MSKKKKSGKEKSSPDSKINLIAAFVNLITAILLAITASKG